jgi:hypothetical protein
VLAAVSKLCVAGEKIVTICEKGDKLIEEEVGKVFAKTKLKGECLRVTLTSLKLPEVSKPSTYTASP